MASLVGSRVLRWDVARAVAPRSGMPPDHKLTLYDFEGSPWCRLVREHATILDLTVDIRPCPRETLLYGEGAFSSKSRFRPEAMERYQVKYPNCDHLTFPLLVDKTHTTANKKWDGDNSDAVIVNESYDILCHLWQQYGSSVILRKEDNRRPDQIVNSSSLPFIMRFLSLAGPSYMRPWPRCGVMRFPSSPSSSKARVTLYGAEGCPESRLVREVLCSLEIPYRSVPVAYGSSNHLPIQTTNTETVEDGNCGDGSTIQIPVLEVCTAAETESSRSDCMYSVGAKECVDYLHDTYYDQKQANTNHAATSIFTNNPTWFDSLPKENLGRQTTGDGTNSVAFGAYTAFLKGTRAFVPKQAMK